MIFLGELLLICEADMHLVLLYENVVSVEASTGIGESAGAVCHGIERSLDGVHHSPPHKHTATSLYFRPRDIRAPPHT